MSLITQGKTNLTYLLIVIVIALVVGGGILFYYYSWITDLDARLAQIELKLPSGSSPECVKDSDCKLIYGSCNCISVPTDMDEQEALEKLPDKDILCFVNDCQMKNAQAVCLKGTCHVEFSEDKTADWEVYMDEKGGFTLKYPSNFDYYEISPAGLYASATISFQKADRPVSFEWPRFEVGKFNSDTFSLIDWLEKRWLKDDIPVGGSRYFQENLNRLLNESEHLLINDYQAIKLSQVYGSGGYDADFIFIHNGTDTIIKTSCLILASEFCDQMLSTFKFVDAETVNWEVYKNEEYGFEIKYPPKYEVSEDSGTSVAPLIRANSYAQVEFWIYSDDYIEETRERIKDYEKIQVGQIEAIRSPLGGNIDRGVEFEIFFLDFSTKDEIFRILFSTHIPGKENEINIFNQMLSTFKFIELGGFDLEKMSKVISFVDSMGIAKKIFRYNTFDENYQINIYITDNNFNRDSAIRIINVAETNIGDSPYVSPSGGKRYIVIERYGMGDSFGMAIADEDGKVITQWLASEHSDLIVVWNFERWKSSSTFWAKARMKGEGDVEILVDAKTAEIIEIKPLPQ